MRRLFWPICFFLSWSHICHLQLSAAGSVLSNIDIRFPIGWGYTLAPETRSNSLEIGGRYAGRELVYTRILTDANLELLYGFWAN